MFFSLIVATWRRREPLARLLESLRKQTMRDFEVIVVDQNPPGFLDRTLAGFADLPLRVCRTPHVGVSHARNVGIRIISPWSDLLAFPDDDCRYLPDTLANAGEFFAAHPELNVFLAGDPTGSCGKPKRLNRQQLFFHGETFMQFYRRIDPVQLFDETMGPGVDIPIRGGEDTDYLIRFASGHGDVFRCPQVLVGHPRAPVMDQRKVADYAQARMYLLWKYRYPLYFKLMNVGYPLLRWGLDGGRSTRLCLNMFCCRLKFLK